MPGALRSGVVVLVIARTSAPAPPPAAPPPPHDPEAGDHGSRVDGRRGSHGPEAAGDPLDGEGEGEGRPGERRRRSGRHAEAAGDSQEG
jgi:hypothetical protein